MAMEKGNRARIIDGKGEVYEGTLYEVCFDTGKESPKRANIFVSEVKSENRNYGTFGLFCEDLQEIEICE